jgi:hypothetical protein
MRDRRWDVTMKIHTKDAATQTYEGRRWGALRERAGVVLQVVTSTTEQLDKILLAAGLYEASRYFSPLRHKATMTPSCRRAMATIAFFLPHRCRKPS